MPLELDVIESKEGDNVEWVDNLLNSKALLQSLKEGRLPIVEIGFFTLIVTYIDNSGYSTIYYGIVKNNAYKED